MSTKIEWAEDVWNPTLGCTLIAPGCRSCYAMRDAYRKQFHPNEKIRAAYAGLTQLTNGHPVWTGKVNLMEDRLSIPLRKRKPTTWFVDSMSDLFHADVPDDFILSVFQQIGKCPRHRFIILTKRHSRMADLLSRRRWRNFGHSPAMGGDHYVAVTPGEHRDSDAQCLPNVILGASASDQATFDSAIPAMRTLAGDEWNTVWSLEPLLGPIDVSEAVSNREPTLAQVNSDRGLYYIRHGAPWASWVIVGGESGPDARPCNTRWIRDIVRQCADAFVPCFVKQIGARAIQQRDTEGDIHPWLTFDRKGGDMAEWPKDLRVRQLPEVLR